MTTDQKTTMAGILKIVAVLGSFFGTTLSPENQNSLMAAGVIAYSFFSGLQAHFTNK